MLTIKNVSVSAGNFMLKDLNLCVEEGSFCILLGKSGAGKTVFLEMLAGRYPVKSGSILWNGIDITPLPPEKRNIALVYQDFALFPHLNVFQNIAFPLFRSQYSKKERKEKVEELLEAFSLSAIASMYPQTLSGGERQRVAIARALAAEPKLLLLDEPMSALDCVTKEMVKKTLKKVHSYSKTTIIQVTHDFEEAQYFADSFAVMKKKTLSPLCKKEKIITMKKEDAYALLNS